MPNNKNKKVDKPFVRTKFYQQLKPEGVPVLEPAVKVEATATIQGSDE